MKANNITNLESDTLCIDWSLMDTQCCHSNDMVTAAQMSDIRAINGTIYRPYVGSDVSRNWLECTMYTLNLEYTILPCELDMFHLP